MVIDSKNYYFTNLVSFLKNMIGFNKNYDVCNILSPGKCNLNISLRLRLNVWQQPNVIADAVNLR